MSFDFRIAQPCPHLVVEDGAALSSDRMSLPTRAPIASNGVVRILANDEYFIPSGGLYSQAQITGATAGPFVIRDCDTTFTVTASTETASVSLPVGSAVEPNVIVRLLNAALSSVAVEVVSGHLVLTDTGSIGQSSRILVSGDAAESLGFAGQRGARGAQVYPGWGLVDAGPAFSPLATSNNNASRAASALSFKYPRFFEPIRANPTFKVTYATDPRQCLRCRATFVENDYMFDLRGDHIVVDNANLLYQAALKILLTEIRSNPYHAWYGSSLKSRIGTKAVGAVTSEITASVQAALSNMQQLQGKQAKYQTVTPDERLYSITSIRVTQDRNDPTVYQVDVVVQNASGQPVSLSIVFTTPGAVALVGTNGLSLGLEAVGLGTSRTS